MGPLYYAGSADQLKSCVEELEAIIAPRFLRYIEVIKDIKANPDAGEPNLSYRWNRCLAAIQYMDKEYNGKREDERV